MKTIVHLDTSYFLTDAFWRKLHACEQNFCLQQWVYFNPKFIFRRKEKFAMKFNWFVPEWIFHYVFDRFSMSKTMVDIHKKYEKTTQHTWTTNRTNRKEITICFFGDNFSTSPSWSRIYSSILFIFPSICRIPTYCIYVRVCFKTENTYRKNRFE